MKINITYPYIKKQKKSNYLKVLNLFQIIFVLIAITCPIINIIIGGKPWSIIILLVMHISYGHFFYY